MPAVNPSTDRPTSCVAPVLHAGEVEHVAQPDAGPLGVADESAADLVADAGDRHVLLEHRHRRRARPTSGRLAVDHAVDAQRPRRDVDRRGEQGGVDPIELVVRDDDRGQAGRGRREVRAGSAVARRPRPPAGSAPPTPAGAVRPRSISQRPVRPRDRGGDAERARPEQERAAERVGRQRSGCRRRRPVAAIARGGSCPGQRLDPDPGRQRRLDGDHGRVGERVAERGEEPERAERQRSRRRPASNERRARMPRSAPIATAASTTTTSRASLSFVPNRATTKSLAPGGCRSMTTLADRRDEGRGARQEAGDQLGDAEGHGGGDRAGQRRQPGLVADRGLDMEGRARRRGHEAHGAPVVDDVRVSGHVPRRRRSIVRHGASTARSRPNAADSTSSRRTSSIGPASATAPSRQHEDVIEAERDLLEVVGDEDDRRRSCLRGECRQVAEQEFAGREVQAGRRLVEEQDLRDPA